MNNVLLILNKGFDFLTPFVKRFWGVILAFIGVAADKVNRSNKKAKMHIRLMKFKNMLEIASNIILLIASVIALFCAIGEYIKRRNN